MRNENYVRSLNKIEPDRAAQARMLESILAARPTRKEFPMRKTMKWLAPLAACLVLAVTAATLAPRFLGGAKISPPVDNGVPVLHFAKGNLPAAQSIDNGLMMEGRALTAEEDETVFGSLAQTHEITAYGRFYHYNGALAGVEAHAALGSGLQAKIELWQKDAVALDTVLVGEEGTNDVDGTPVKAGYFITDKNSRGIRNAIYYVSFELGEIFCYVQLGDEASQSQALQSEITAIVAALVQSGAPELAGIHLA